jgi:membrane protein
MVIPETEPQGRLTLAADTSVVCGSPAVEGAVVVESTAVVSGSEVSISAGTDVLVEAGAVVVVDSVGSAGVGDTMLSPPATHAEASADSMTRREISRRIPGECRKWTDLCCGNGRAAISITSTLVTSPRLPEPLAFLDPLVGRLRLADPLLMAAAIAFNLFFALVPLTIAFVGILATIGKGDSLISVQQTVAEALPQELADFVVTLIQDAADAVGDWSGLVVLAGLLVALWSGSRGIYAIQKSLRLMEGAIEHRPYWRVRGLGILFTVMAGVALVGGYVVVVLGSFLENLLESSFDLDFGTLTNSGTIALAGWLVLVLFVIYRWGPPQPVSGAFLAAAITAVLIVFGTWLAAVIIPLFGNNTLTFLGVVGVLLLWLYYVGLAVVMIPTVVSVVWEHYRGSASAE